MHSVDSDYTVHDGRRCIRRQQVTPHLALSLWLGRCCAALSRILTQTCVFVCVVVGACVPVHKAVCYAHRFVCACACAWAWLGGNVTTLICLAPTLLCVGTFLPFTQTMSNTYPQEAVAIHASRWRLDDWFSAKSVWDVQMSLNITIEITLENATFLKFDFSGRVEMKGGDITKFKWWLDHLPNVLVFLLSLKIEESYGSHAWKCKAIESTWVAQLSINSELQFVSG